MKPQLLKANLVLGLCALLVAPGHPAEAALAGQVVESGQVEGVALPPEPGEAGTGLGPARPFVDRHFLNHSDQIEARLCRHFGIAVRFTASAGDVLPGRIMARVRHPLLTRPDGMTSRVDDFPTTIVDGNTYVGFGFDYPWEMQPGEWSVAVMLGDQVLAEKTFTITLPPAGAPLSDCPAPQVS
jgi:hypothetical protein